MGQASQAYLQSCPAAERDYLPRGAVEQWLGICNEQPYIKYNTGTQKAVSK